MVFGFHLVTSWSDRYYQSQMATCKSAHTDFAFLYRFRIHYRDPQITSYRLHVRTIRKRDSTSRTIETANIGVSVRVRGLVHWFDKQHSLRGKAVPKSRLKIVSIVMFVLEYADYGN